MTSVHLLDGGTLDVEFSIVVPGSGFGNRLVVPVPMYLVGTTQGFILIDTGNDPTVIDDPVLAWGEELARAARPWMDATHHPLEQLRLLGLSAKDVKAVVYTHLHHDHAGGGRMFPDAVHVVQRVEHNWASSTDPAAAGAYVPGDIAGSRNWHLVDGDRQLLPGVSLIVTAGHTPGHQSVMLWDVPDLGNVILAGDAINTFANIASDLPPGITTDALGAVFSMRRLTALAEATDAILIPGHDMRQFAAMPKAPAPLRRTADWPLPENLAPRVPGVQALWPSGP